MNVRATVGDVVTKVARGASIEFASVSNDELLEGTRRLVGRSNQLLAALLAHLGEVEARGIYRKCSCASLYTYCICELRFSEDEAARRAAATKWVRKFPRLLEAVAKGELHLTGLLMLGPLLTEENIAEVLGRAKFRTKKELGKLVRTLAPLPRVPDRVEPLGPELPRALRNPTWAEFVESLCPPVRELPEGKRPADWANETGIGEAHARIGETEVATRVTLTPLTEPHLFHMQFTTGEEHVKLIERARALLVGDKGKGLADLHLQAMRLLVEKLEKRRFGAPRRPQSAGADESPRQRGSATDDAAGAHDESPRQRGLDGESPCPSVKDEPTSRRTRYIRARVKRVVFERDEGRCTHVDDRGVRCRETDALELHHLDAFATGGASIASRMTLRCRAHNALAAEEDFGREYIEGRRDRDRHESLRQASRDQDSDED